MVRALVRWWTRWRMETSQQELDDLCMRGECGPEFVANTLVYIARMRDKLERLQ